MEDDILALGAEIIWVLEADYNGDPGTARLCEERMSELGATKGWCVGDGQTVPTPGTWDDSPFSVGRGFDLLVPTKSMEIAFSSSHGTPSGNDNLNGDAFVEALEDVIAGL